MTLIKARLGQPPLYMQGPFSCELAPALVARQARTFTFPLYLGVLMTCPDVDGHGSVELDDEDYQRQAVEFGPRSSSHIAILHPVLFNLRRRPLMWGLGLYSAAGDLEAYGALRSGKPGHKPPSHFEFRPYQILIRRPDR